MKNALYNLLLEAFTLMHKSHLVIRLGDFIAVSGMTRNLCNVVIRYGSGIPNDNTEKLPNPNPPQRIIAGVNPRPSSIHLIDLDPEVHLEMTSETEVALMWSGHNAKMARFQASVELHQ